MKIDKFNKAAYNRTLSEASKDDSHGVPLIEDDNRIACKLDDLTKRVCEELRDKQPTAGCDAYLETNGNYWFIEFKNEYADSINAKTVKQIWRKAYDSICTVRMAIDQTITLDDLCQNAIFLVVYRDEEPKTENGIERKTAELADEEHIRWGLRKIVGKLYCEVHTIPATEFRQKWIPRIWGAEI